MTSLLNVDAIKNAAGTGAPSFTNGISGSTTNTAAATGIIGEVLTASLASASAMSLSTGTSATLTSVTITLTAGDWDIRGAIFFLPAASTSITVLVAGISATTNSITSGAMNVPNGSANGEYKVSFETAAQVPTNNGLITLALPPYQVLVANAVTLPLYLVANATFTVSTMTAGGWMQARRMR